MELSKLGSTRGTCCAGKRLRSFYLFVGFLKPLEQSMSYTELLHVHLSSRGFFDVTSLPTFDWPNNEKTYIKDV